MKRAAIALVAILITTASASAGGYYPSRHYGGYGRWHNQGRHYSDHYHGHHYRHYGHHHHRSHGHRLGGFISGAIGGAIAHEMRRHYHEPPPSYCECD